MLKNELKIDYIPPKKLKDYHRQLRKPSKQQIEKTIALINHVGLATPIVIDKDNYIVIGWPFAEAAKQMNIDSVPVVCVDHLTQEQTRMLRIAYDRIALDADWDEAALSIEFQELEVLVPDLDLSISGFEKPEIDFILEFPTSTAENEEEHNPVDELPDIEEISITKPGDLWQLGDHLLYCGNSLEEKSFEALMGKDKAQMCFTDAPYNVKIDGHVGGKGDIKHREFEMASGEMNEDQFTEFLSIAHKHISSFTNDGSIVFSCMDWRHQKEILKAGKSAKFSLLNICVWVKNNGGMGSLYRSQHEFVMVFKSGNAKHINNIELGKYGRNRTNVWNYPGVNAFRADRMEELHLHPTVKPVSMITDAIMDCSNRSDIILDPFGGAGTTLIAAEQTNRKARLIEIDPLYCDVTIRRWQNQTGLEATHSTSGISFDKINRKGNKDVA